MKRAHSWARCAAVMPATPLVGQCRRPARAEHHPGRVTAGDPLQTAAPHRDSWAAGSVSGCTVAHFRVRSETGARLSLLILAVTTAGIALVALLLDPIVDDPVSVLAMLVIVILAIILDVTWKRVRARRAQVIRLLLPHV
jgi:hypothetical protein